MAFDLNPFSDAGIRFYTPLVLITLGLYVFGIDMVRSLVDWGIAGSPITIGAALATIGFVAAWRMYSKDF